MASVTDTKEGNGTEQQRECFVNSPRYNLRVQQFSARKELHVLRGHEDEVSNAQFSADGKTVVTGSADTTARLWQCEVCRNVDEIATELAKAVGRELTEEERRRFGVPEALFIKK